MIEDSFIHSQLIRGAVVLTIGIALIELAFRWGGIYSPRLRQWCCGLVLLAACLPAPFPVTLPWLPPAPLPPLASDPIASRLRTELQPATPAIDLLTTQNNAPLLEITAPPNVPLSSNCIHQRPFSFALCLRLLGPLWLAGVALIVLRDGILYFRVLRRIRREQVQLTTEQIQVPESWRNELQQTPSTLPLLVTRSIGPLLGLLPCGFALLVPRDYWAQLSSSQRRAVLRHEQAHYERGDVLASFAVRLLAILFWFHPAAWRLAALFDEAAEWACDQAAAGADDAPAFARALEQLCNPQNPAVSLVLGRSAQSHPLVQRVRRLLNPVPTEDSLMKRLLSGAAIGAFVLASLVQFRLTAQEQSNPSLEGVKEQMQQLDETLAALKEKASAAKAEAGDLKSKVEAKISALKELVKTPEQLSAGAQKRIEQLKSGVADEQLKALEGAEKLGDEGLILCAFAAKEGADETVRRKALSTAISLGNDGLPVLAFAYEGLPAADRLFAAEALAKNKANIHPAVFARLCGDADDKVRGAALQVVLESAEPLVNLALAAENNESLAAEVLAKADQVKGEDLRTLLYAGAKKGPESLLPGLVKKAAPLKQQAYPIFAAVFTRKTAESRAELVKLFRNSSQPLEQLLIEKALTDEDETLRAAAEKAKAE
jgi:beta-lactamase regulating signal transducer with metallopeptidase domain